MNILNTHIIILNLKRSAERKQLLVDQFKKIGLTDGLNYTFWPAFDGNDIINMRMSAPIIKGVGIGRNLEKSELSIIMSHVSALKHAQVMKYKNVVILEDDVMICEDWEDRLNILEGLLPETWEYVYLSGHSDYTVIPMSKTPKIISAPTMVGAFSYLVNKKGIEKIAKFATNFITTYDDMIMHKVQGGKLEGYLYLPFMTCHVAKESYIWGVTSQDHSSRKYFKNKL